MNNMKRMRGRNHRNNGGGGGGGGGGAVVRHHAGATPLNRNHVFDSSGPDLRIRGTAQQLFEKYLQLGRDASGSGDRVMAESYFQYAEHYFRILTAMNQAQQQMHQAQGGQGGAQQYTPIQQHNGPLRRSLDGNGPEGADMDEDGEQPGMGEQPDGATQRERITRELSSNDQGSRDHAPHENGPPEHIARERTPREHRPRERPDHAPRDNGSGRDNGASREGGPREATAREAAPRETAPREIPIAAAPPEG